MNTIIKNTEKTEKQNSFGSKLIINRVWAWMAGMAAVIVLLHAFGATFSTIVGIYLAYKILRLVMRLIGLVFAIVFTVVSIFILIVIIALIII